MWYVIQVPTGQEEQIIEEAKKYEVTEFLTELFTPRWENQKKIQGEWKELTGVIFPGYLFVITETPEALYQTLKRIPRLTKLLGTGENGRHYRKKIFFCWNFCPAESEYSECPGAIRRMAESM